MEYFTNGRNKLNCPLQAIFSSLF